MCYLWVRLKNAKEKIAMLKALTHFDPKYIPVYVCAPGAEPTIFMSEEVVLGKNVYIGPNTQLLGAVRLGKNVRIVGNVVIDGTTGPIIIGAWTRIEPFVFINGPAKIGENCVIRANCVFHNSICGESCDIKGEIESSTLGDNVETYASCIMHNSSCGDHCKLGAMRIEY